MALQEPAENIVIGMKAKNALNATKALPVGQRAAEQAGGRGLMVSPALPLLMGAKDDEENR